MKHIIRKVISILLLSPLFIFAQNPEQKTVKNVIIMIPDGASVDVMALTRWYNNNNSLAIDPIITGLIRTNSADSTIADSAPSSTAYATGSKSLSGYIGVDRNGKPLVNIMELAQMQGKATGFVVTCEHPHATPADFTAHVTSRKDYASICEQQIYFKINVLMSGGGIDFIESILHRNPKLKKK